MECKFKRLVLIPKTISQQQQQHGTAATLLFSNCTNSHFHLLCTFPFNYFAQSFELDDDNNQQQQQLQNHHQHHQQLFQLHQQQPPQLEDVFYTNNRLEEFMPNHSPSSSLSSSANENTWDSNEDEFENANQNEHYPVDLSNDIAINQMAADQGVPYDSDAEIFSVDEHVVQHPISTAYEFVPAAIKK